MEYHIQRILIECKNLASTRREFYNIKSMRELFETIDPDNIINVMKEKKKGLQPNM